MTEFGVHSEVGKLHKVLVHRPGLALTRLTPSNRQELLFDDVVWVKQARVEHMAFVDCMRYRGVEVYLFREMLNQLFTRDPSCWVYEGVVINPMF